MTLKLLQPIDADGEIIPAGKIVQIHEPETAHEMIRQGIGIPVSGIFSNHNTDDKKADTHDTFVLTSPSVAQKPSTPARKDKRSGSNRSKSVMESAAPTKEAQWPPEVQELIDWFMTLDLPTERFWLQDGLYMRSIENPTRFVQSLRRDIEIGPRGTQMMRDKLISDLVALRGKFNGKA